MSKIYQATMELASVPYRTKEHNVYKNRLIDVGERFTYLSARTDADGYNTYIFQSHLDDHLYAFDDIEFDTLILITVPYNKIWNQLNEVQNT